MCPKAQVHPTVFHTSLLKPLYHRGNPTVKVLSYGSDRERQCPTQHTQYTWQIRSQSVISFTSTAAPSCMAQEVAERGRDMYLSLLFGLSEWMCFGTQYSPVLPGVTQRYHTLCPPHSHIGSIYTGYEATEGGRHATVPTLLYTQDAHG